MCLKLIWLTVMVMIVSEEQKMSALRGKLRPLNANFE